MKRIILTFVALLFLNACGIDTSGTQNTSPGESLQKNTETAQSSSSPTVAPVNEDPDKLLAYAERYYTDKNLTEVNIILGKLKNNTPDALEQIEAVQKMSDELDAVKKQEEEKKKDAEAAEIKSKIDKMYVEVDEVTGVTWYRDKSTTKYVNSNSFHLYFGIGNKEDSIPVLRLNIQYTGEDWIFINNYTIKTDNSTYNISPSYGEVKRDNDGGKVWEYYDTHLKSEQHKWIEEIITSDKTIVRHSGDQYHHDRIITAKEKTAMENVLEAFKVLGGYVPEK